MLRKPSTAELKERLVSETFNIEPIVENHKGVLKRLLVVFILAAIFMGVEVAGGIISNSIAILSDAAHMLSDLLGFVISILSVYISGLPANRKHSYGYHRAGVIGALASVMVIWALTGFLIYFAIRRVINLDEVEVEGKLMFGVACFGLLTNLVMIKVLHGGPGHSHGHGGHGHEDDHGHKHEDGHKHDHGHSHKQVHDHKPKEKHSHGHTHELTEQKETNYLVIPIDDNSRHEHSHSHDHKDAQNHSSSHSHSHDHEHDHNNRILPPQVGFGEENTAIMPQVTSNPTEHHHDHDHDHHHDHDHDHEHDHNHGHGHGHDHGHDHKVEVVKNKKKKAHGHGHDHGDMNVRATIIHIFGDILQSIGVIIASGLIWINPEFKIADPIVTFIFAVIVLYTTVRIIKDCIFVLMEGTPADFDLDEFEMNIKSVDGVLEIHDLHVWALGVGKPAMSAHIFTNQNTGAILKRVTRICRQYGIFHSTIQIETVQDKAHADYFECKHNIH